jgi:predicted nucleic acid-binding protein
MDKKLLFDTDVLIDYLRSHRSAVALIEKEPSNRYISSISVAELYAGVRDGYERTQLDQFITGFDVIHINTLIAIHGGLLRREYGKSHGVSFTDALIAATAQHINANLITLNKKHYPMLNVTVPYRKL